MSHQVPRPYSCSRALPHKPLCAVLIVAGALVLVTPLIISPVSTARAAEPALHRCQLALVSISGRHLRRALAARRRCVTSGRKRSPGAGLECVTGDGDQTLADWLTRARVRIGRPVARRCGDVDLVSLGFPGVCNSGEGGVFGSDELAACVSDQEREAAVALGALWLPPVGDVTGKAERKCVSALVKRSLNALTKGLAARHACVLRRDAGKTAADVDCKGEIHPYGSGTGDGPSDQALERAYGRLLSAVAGACSGAQTDQLGYQAWCPDESGGTFDSLDLRRCALGIVRSETRRALELALPIPAVCGDGVVTHPEECDGEAEPGCGAGESCRDNCRCSNACPDRAEVTIFAGYGALCATDDECPLGVCDPATGRCVSATVADFGWKGAGHNSDLNDLGVISGFLDCPAGGPPCGECAVTGIDPSDGLCRCANDNRAVCDEPFEADDDDCGGADCKCYTGAPVPLSSGGVPFCVLGKFSEDVSGTVDVDLGQGKIVANLRAEVFMGVLVVQPCPYCGGTCENDSERECATEHDCGVCSGDVSRECGTDIECVNPPPDDGVCTYAACNVDPVAKDGLRGGLCIDGPNDGMDCDVHSYARSFPARSGKAGGAGMSLDCFPSLGKDVTPGEGLAVQSTLSTGVSELEANLECNAALPGKMCPCKMCSKDASYGCASDADCAWQGGACAAVVNTDCDTNADCGSVDGGRCLGGIFRCMNAFSVECATNADCEGLDGGECRASECSATSLPGIPGASPLPNNCTDGECNDVDGQGLRGECAGEFDVDRFCDAVVKANGDGILNCFSNGDCAPGVIGIAGGICPLEQRRPCFLDPIVAVGAPDPEFPVVSATFCVPPTSGAGKNIAVGLPGPGRVARQVRTRLFCASDPEVKYIPGEGGCPQ